jgi:hypothetical protein
MRYNFIPSILILTGSNMSGEELSYPVWYKYGLLGSVVCAATAADSSVACVGFMRLSDSLSDSESYFFAEINLNKLWTKLRNLHLYCGRNIERNKFVKQRMHRP